MAKNIASEPHQAFELRAHLPYLFKHIYSQVEVASAGQLAHFGVSVAVWRILAVLWEHDDLSHRELAELTSIEVSTLSRVSKSVQRDGLIRRKRTMADQRTVRVTLTDKGRALAQSIIPWAVQCEREMIGDLPPSDVANLTRILHLIADNLNRFAKDDIVAGDETPPKAVRSTRAARAEGPKRAPARKARTVKVAEAG